jgi:hypothetical protein
LCDATNCGDFRINGRIELAARLNAPAAIQQTVRFQASPRLKGPDKHANRKSEAMLQMEAPGRDGGGVKLLVIHPKESELPHLLT